MMLINEASEQLRISDANEQTRLGGRKHRATLYLSDAVVRQCPLSMCIAMRASTIEQSAEQ
jgi:hypothetical protein